MTSEMGQGVASDQTGSSGAGDLERALTALAPRLEPGASGVKSPNVGKQNPNRPGGALELLVEGRRRSVHRLLSSLM